LNSKRSGALSDWFCRRTFTWGQGAAAGVRDCFLCIQNVPASKAYGVRADEPLAWVKGLEADVTNLLVDAQAADWGQIGDLGRALELAQQLRDLLRGEAD